jgi:hypothetical protein
MCLQRELVIQVEIKNKLCMTNNQQFVFQLGICEIVASVFNGDENQLYLSPVNMVVWESFNYQAYLDRTESVFKQNYKKVYGLQKLTNPKRGDENAHIDFECLTAKLLHANRDSHKAKQICTNRIADLIRTNQLKGFVDRVFKFVLQIENSVFVFNCPLA